jgi:hypothetical protein
MGSMGDETQIDAAPWRSRLWDHAGLIGSGLLTALVSVRLLAVSNFDPLTATALLSFANTPTVLFGILLPAISILGLAVFLPLGASYSAERWMRDKFYRPGPAVMAIVLALCAVDAMVVPWPFTVIFIGASIGMAISSARLAAREHRVAGKLEARASRVMRGPLVWVVFVVVVSGTLMFRTSPWLPTERLVFESNKAITAFVLESSDSELVLLRDRDRVITRVKAAEVVTRGVCRQARDDDELWIDRAPSLGAILTGATTPTYPACP